MSFIIWKWGEHQAGATAHASLEGEAEALCGAPTKGASLFHGPWFELRCETCEQRRAGRAEVFHNPHARDAVHFEEDAQRRLKEHYKTLNGDEDADPAT